MDVTETNGCLHADEIPPENIIFGRTEEMAIAHAKVQLAASVDAPVLLQGESGTGKEIVAKLLHVRSSRSRQPWVKVICPAIPGALLETELFGYERGAFTGAYATKRGRVEMAHRGALFLDEIGSLDLAAQAKLLQFLQDGTFTRVGDYETRKVDARVLSCANLSLERMTDEGTFRLDLLYRLNAITITLPPLRQRTQDIPEIAEYLRDHYCRILHRNTPPLSAQLLRQMQRYNWPGNIRQLENLIRSYVVIGSEEVISSQLCPSESDFAPMHIDLDHPVSLKAVTKAATQKLERDVILAVLRLQGGSRRKTAKWLNISYRSLMYKLDNVRSNNGRIA
jgi:two-component system response regulator AtoC